MRGPSVRQGQGDHTMGLGSRPEDGTNETHTLYMAQTSRIYDVQELQIYVESYLRSPAHMNFIMPRWSGRWNEVYNPRVALETPRKA